VNSLNLNDTVEYPSLPGAWIEGDCKGLLEATGGPAPSALLEPKLGENLGSEIPFDLSRERGDARERANPGATIRHPAPSEPRRRRPNTECQQISAVRPPTAARRTPSLG
jgi:hypothetical protein